MKHLSNPSLIFQSPGLKIYFKIKLLSKWNDTWHFCMYSFIIAIIYHNSRIVDKYVSFQWLIWYLIDLFWYHLLLLPRMNYFTFCIYVNFIVKMYSKIWDTISTILTFRFCTDVVSENIFCSFDEIIFVDWIFLALTKK